MKNQQASAERARLAPRPKTARNPLAIPQRNEKPTCCKHINYSKHTLLQTTVAYEGRGNVLLCTRQDRRLHSDSSSFFPPHNGFTITLRYLMSPDNGSFLLKLAVIMIHNAE